MKNLNYRRPLFRLSPTLSFMAVFLLLIIGMVNTTSASVTLVGYNTVPINGNRTLAITLTAGENQSQDFTVLVTNSNPASLTLSNAVNNVLAVTFLQGGATNQIIAVQGVALGTATLTATAGASANVVTIPTSGLIGHWLAGQQDLTDTAGYSQAGEHDGVAAPGSFSSDPGFTADAPPGFTGYSADLGLNGCIIQIQNTSQANDGANYDSTFDNLIAQQMSVSFWAKWDEGTTVGNWQPYISKRGEEAAWQIRTAADQPIASFTVRGIPGGQDEFDSPTIITNAVWHHFVASRDGVTGQRKLYIDGQLSGFIPNDFGSYSLDSDAYLILGGQWTQQSGVGGSANKQFFGELYDMRIYADALNGSQVQNLFTPNMGNIVAFADTPAIDEGKTGSISISIPDGANATQSVSVTVTNNSGLVNIAGFTGNVFTVTFPAGAPNTTTLELTAGTTEGVAQLGFGSSSLNPASVSVFVSGPHLIGEWGTNSTLSDVSGYTNYNTVAGTHDGYAIGSGSINYSADVPNTKPGQSLDLTSGNVDVLITNTSVADSNYRPTFDDLISHQFSVSCWVKENTGQNWTAFTAKRGDDDTGWQVRRYGNNNSASFTLRDSSSESGDMGGNVTVVNDGKWHHVAAVWDGYAGIRQLYVDGVLDTSISNDFAPFCLAKGYHLVLGAEENRGVGEGISVGNQFSGLLYDVRVYNYPLTADQVLNLATLGTVQLIGPGIFPVASTNAVTVSIPSGANQNQSVTVNVSSSDTDVASIVGAVSNVKTLTFTAGGPIAQTIQVVGIGGGKTSLTASSTGLTAGTLAVIAFAQPSPQLVGHWFAGSQTLADVSGFTPVGTHDGVAVGSTPGAYAWDADVPAGYSGSSLDLTANGSGGQVAILVTNTTMNDSNYQVTFDNQITNKFTIAFWAKGYTEGTWNPFITKDGESTGWQFRMNPNLANNPSFTIRGSAGPDDIWGNANNTLDDGNWHHYAGTYDSQTGFRAIYVDGQQQLLISGDTGGVTPTPFNHLVLGAKEDGGLSGWFSGQLFDVRIYNYALSSGEVQSLAAPPSTLAVSANYTNVPAGDSIILTVTIPSGANATQPVTVLLTNNAPNVATIVGSVNNTLSLTFPVGALPGQSVTLTTVGPGAINITAIMGATTANLATTSTVYAPALVGHWLTGDADLADKSGYTLTGTHDGVAVGDNPSQLAFSNSVPAGFSGESLDLTANSSGANVGVAITNSSTSDAAYQPTFDNPLAFSVAFWAKGFPTPNFNPFVSKDGEDSGFQIRRYADQNYPTFTLRGTPDDDDPNITLNPNVTDGQWHHYAATWDGLSGTRAFYVDGVAQFVLSSDFGPMSLALADHLILGGREQNSALNNGAWFSGLLYDVRFYNYAISPSDVAALQQSSTAVILTVNPGTNNTVVLSWPGSAAGYTLQTSPTLNGGWSTSTLTPVLQGGQYVATDSVTNSTRFYRLVHSGN